MGRDFRGVFNMDRLRLVIIDQAVIYLSKILPLIGSAFLEMYPGVFTPQFSANFAFGAAAGKYAQLA